MKYTKEIYLDASSTTPPRQEVIDLIFNIQRESWGNPSNLHSVGIKAEELLERSRCSMSKLLSCANEDIIYTSGATESINLGIIGTAKSITPGRIVISTVEHPSVREAAKSLVKYGWEVDFWPVDNNGNIELKYTDKYLSKQTKIVSIIWGQSEIGTIQPVELIGRECQNRGIIFHTDATQYITQSKISWSNLPIDLLSGSAHKLRGPRGTGFLLKKSSNVVKPSPLFSGGPQEGGLRSGTESVALIAGMDLALKLLYDKNYNSDKNNIETVKEMTSSLKKELSKLDFIKFTGDPYNRLNHHISMIIKNSNDKVIYGRSLVLELAKRGICASSGSACSSSSNESSYVLNAIGIDPALQRSALRLTLGDWLDNEDISSVPFTIKDIINQFTI